MASHVLSPQELENLAHLKQEIDQIKARLDSGEEELIDGEEFFKRNAPNGA